MIAIPIKNGVVHLAESRALCPTCKTPIGFNAIEEKWQRSKTGHVRHKCNNCENSCMVTQDIQGDFVAYLPKPFHNQLSKNTKK